jgi:CxxC motif-containing protein
MKSSIDLVCICCPLGCNLSIINSNDEITVNGNKCFRGKKYAVEEITAPKRIITSTVRITGGAYPVISVKTTSPVPKEKIFDIMDILAKVDLVAPIYIHEVIVKNIADTKIDVVATKTQEKI